jgi:hypothetical protein
VIVSRDAALLLLSFGRSVVTRREGAVVVRRRRGMISNSLTWLIAPVPAEAPQVKKGRLDNVLVTAIPRSVTRHGATRFVGASKAP